MYNSAAQYNFNLLSCARELYRQTIMHLLHSHGVRPSADDHLVRTGVVVATGMRRQGNVYVMARRCEEDEDVGRGHQLVSAVRQLRAVVRGAERQATAARRDQARCCDDR